LNGGSLSALTKERIESLRRVNGNTVALALVLDFLILIGEAL